PALSGLREARCDRRAAPGIATHIGTHHGLDHHRLRPAVAVARVSEAHPGPGRPGALWMADGGWRTWRGSRMRPSALSGLREARTSRWRGRGDGPGLVALQARGDAMRPSALSGLREARASRSRGRGDGPDLATLQARGGAMRPSALSGLREARCG